MSRINNMFILLLITLLFVSCKFFGNKSSGKKAPPTLTAASRDSKLGSIPLTASSKKGENTSDAPGDADKSQRDVQKSSTDMLASDDSTAASKDNTDKKETKGKLSKEDKDKLTSFFRKTIRYQSSLYSIYNKYVRHYNTIATYTGCGEYSISCFSAGPSARRSQAIAALKNNNLDNDYTNLSNMIKSVVPSYNTKTLDDAIAAYKQAVSKASDAEEEIEIVNDYSETQSAKQEKKKKNIDHLKTIRRVLTVIEKTIETASLAYADAFAIVSDSLSCSKFRQAICKFSKAAKEYANGNKGDHAVDVIVGAIAGMSHASFEKSFDKAKRFANKESGEEVDKMVAAIDTLCDVYKIVK
ncbi:hypothetical protein F0310_05420 (plasmid) [Borrelia sp. A-FGy1]|uniref:hypothetical protein n=1 Tax=Borrelia sp. A-FGy1 TaxID=2608247 RepID=UPI0015F5745C|nr:hypothetical protein [Borrelia sp. A-FGy1]QMU99852.1 hypothetical protein F0310_05420 [Borrelia sp. A-FGy1]